MNRNGFSLLELVITLSIFVTILFFTIPRFSFVSSFIINNEVDRLYSTFYFLQQKAIAINEEQKLYLDLSRNGYYYFGKNNNKCFHKFHNSVKFGILAGALGPPSKPRKKIKKVITFKKVDKNIFRVSFLSDGIISPGNLYLVSNDKKHLMGIGCPVSPFSFIKKYRYQNKVWVSLN